MTTVFVTGGTGFLGQRLVRTLLADGHTVRMLVRPDPTPHSRRVAHDLRAQGAVLVPGELLDERVLRTALHGVRQVFHLAGRLFMPGVPAQLYEEVHVNGTRALVIACAHQNSLDTIVHCSTTGVRGPTGHVYAAEDAPLRPSNTYEQTKAEGEQLALSLAAAHQLPLVVARPALVYGPGDLHLLGWFRTIQRGYYRVVGRGDSLLHPIYIDDLVTGLRRCADVPTAIGRVYHLVGEQALPIRELAAAIARALGTRLPHQPLPAAFAWAAASLLEALPGIDATRLPLTRSRLSFMSQSRAYCGERARHELGFVPHIALEAGLERTVAWYRREGLL